MGKEAVRFVNIWVYEWAVVIVGETTSLFSTSEIVWILANAGTFFSFKIEQVNF